MFPKLDYNGFLEPHHRRRIRLIREEFGLTYKDFGQLIGCDWSTILKWENGNSTKSQEAMTNILRQIFQGELDALLGRKRKRLRKIMEAKLNDLIADRSLQP